MKAFRSGWRGGAECGSKHAEVTAPSLDDWEKEWVDSQRNVHPQLLPAAAQDKFRAKVRHRFALITVAVPANAFGEDFSVFAGE